MDKKKRLAALGHVCNNKNQFIEGTIFMSNNKPLIFLHIPKTAGTSLRMALSESLGDHLKMVYNDPENFQSTDDIRNSDKTGISVVFGHYCFGVHHQLGLEPRYACVLRDPVHRVLSWISHVKSDKRHQFHDDLTRLGSEKFVLSGKTEEVSNHQTMIISGIGGHAIDEAKLNIENFDFVGTTETIKDSTHRLGIVIGKDISVVPHANAGAQHEHSPSLIEAIKQTNHNDNELYLHTLSMLGFPGNFPPKS